MGKRRTKKQQLIIKKKKLVCIFLCLLVSVFGYFILLTDSFKPKLNTLTTNYISFNNRISTDMLRFDNLKRMSNKKGIALANYKSLNFTIPKGKDVNYDIELVPINNEIEDKYVHYILNGEHKTLDKGRIIYQGNVSDNTKICLYMWIAKEYKGKCNNISYEVRIKSR